MVVHLVLIKLKPGAVRTEPRVKRWEEMLAALPDKIDGIVRWESGWNTTERPHAYDYGINSAFATRADLDAYQPHPAHQEMVVALREFADWVICDYVLGEFLTD